MNTKIYLKDSQGRVLEVQNLNSGSKHEFDVDKLQDGTYFVELHLAKGRPIMHQFRVCH